MSSRWRQRLDQEAPTQRFRNACPCWDVMNPMNASSGTDVAPIRPQEARPWRAVAWVAVSLVLFVVLLLLTLLVASRPTLDLGIAFPQREHFAVTRAMLFGASLLVAVPLAGRALGQATVMWPGLLATLPFVLAALLGYLIVEDVRGGGSYETDQALPEIFVPVAIALLASAGVGRRVAATEIGRRAWSWVTVGSAVAILALVVLSAAKASFGTSAPTDVELGRSTALDSPLTFAALAAAAAYAVTAVAALMASGKWTRSFQRG